MNMIYFPILPSFPQLSRSGMPARKGKLMNLNTSTTCIVNASSIARGISQYVQMKTNNKIPGTPFLFHFSKNPGNRTWKKRAISMPEITNNGICKRIGIAIFHPISVATGGRMRQAYSPEPYIACFIIYPSLLFPDCQLLYQPPSLFPYNPAHQSSRHVDPLDNLRSYV